jgi:hypothetical protein
MINYTFILLFIASAIVIYSLWCLLFNTARPAVYLLTEKGIMLFNEDGGCLYSCDDTTCTATCVKLKTGVNCTPCVEDFFGKHKTEGFEPPNLLPNEGIDLAEFDTIVDLTSIHPDHRLIHNIFDNIVGRIPGVDGKGIKKLKVKAKFDGNTYIVRDFPDYQKSAEILAKLHADTVKLIDYINEKYPNSEYTIELNKNYDGNLSEMTPKNLENLTSYTVDKMQIVSCLREKRPGHKHHDYNLLLYVFIHELSHMANKNSFGHDHHFENAFVWMLQRADELGILKRIDFEKTPQNFCGLPITTNLSY